MMTKSKKNIKVLFYTMNWYPFEGSIQHIYRTVLKHLKERGYEITILTSIPYFLNGREERWASYRGKAFITEHREGIRTVRTFVLSPYFMRRFKVPIRIINCISFAFSSLLAGLFIGKYDVILTVSHPPLLIGLASFIMGKIKGCKYVYSLQDIYPDILRDLGMVKNGKIFNFLRKIELFIYEKAGKICVLSSQMADNLSQKGINPEKIELTPHFTDLNTIVPLSKQNPFAREYRLDSKFVVLFPGSVSYRSDLDTILESAKILSDEENIRFVFMERGELKDAFRRKAASRGLENMVFLPFQPAERFPQVLASADVGLVSLDREFSAYSVPSKIYNIMASARPVIAVVDENSEVSRIVREAECGLSVPPGNAGLLAERIRELAVDKGKREEMGQNGRIFVERYHDQTGICQKYEQVICREINI